MHCLGRKPWLVAPIRLNPQRVEHPSLIRVWMWCASLGDHVLPLPGSSNAPRTIENLTAANITLTEEEKKELDDLVATFEVTGDRYPAMAKGDLMR